MTRYAIGDIHGGAKTFSALLKRLNLRHSDSLYLLGDYVDRGKDSKGVLDIMLSLMDSGYDLRPIRGNHDDMMLHAMTGNNDKFSDQWLSTWGRKTLRSFGVATADLVPARYLTLIDSLPFIQLTENYVFVHAGLDMDTEDPLTQSSPTVMQWGEINAVDSKKLGGRKLVTGHTIRPLPLIEVSLLSNRIYLDNGACTNMLPDLGNLVALNIDTLELTIQPWLDGEVLP